MERKKVTVLDLQRNTWTGCLLREMRSCEEPESPGFRVPSDRGNAHVARS